MTPETLTLVAQAIIMPATLLASLVVTVIVAITSHRTARRLSALEMLRGVDQQWQGLNAAILSQPQIQRHIEPEGAPGSERAIVRRNIAFYVLNLTLQLERAKAAGMIDAPTARLVQDSQADFLAHLRPEVEAIIAGSAIYRVELADFLQRFHAMAQK